jgi:putative nucleotidyltransferase with HDIG domain
VQEEQTVLTLIKAAEVRDPYLGYHMKDVSQLSISIGHQMALPEDEVDLLAVGALLHDIGKIGSPDSILRKPGRLDQAEYEIIRSHPELGARILAEAGLSGAIPAVKHHHERFDGGGYPDGLAGEEIPLLARIVGVADAYSTMIHDKPYRKKIAHTAALEEVLRHSGSQFDPEVVAALVAVLPRAEQRPMGNTS